MDPYQIIPRRWMDELQYARSCPTVKLAIRFLLITAMLVAVIALAYWWPMSSQHGNLRLQIDTIRRDLVDSVNAEQVGNAYSQSLKRISEIEKKLDNQDRQSSLVKHVLKLAQQHRVRILSEAYEEGKPREGYLPLHQTLTIQSDYRSLRKFLLGIDNLPTWTVVSEAKLERLKSRPGKIKALLRLITYRKTASPSGGSA